MPPPRRKTNDIAQVLIQIDRYDIMISAIRILDNAQISIDQDQPQILAVRVLKAPSRPLAIAEVGDTVHPNVPWQAITRSSLVPVASKSWIVSHHTCHQAGAPCWPCSPLHLP